MSERTETAIPEEAVEAAAGMFAGRLDKQTWSTMTEHGHNFYRHPAEAALQAALPHLRAALYAEFRERLLSDEAIEAVVDAARQPVEEKLGIPVAPDFADNCEANYRRSIAAAFDHALQDQGEKDGLG